MGNEIQASTLSRVKGLVNSETTKKRFEDVLGRKAPQFIASIVNAVSSNKYLQKCEPSTILSSALIAAALDLPIDQNLGFAYIVPYKDKAQFQMGYKGFIQLAMRTGKYKTINACPIYEGEYLGENRITGEMYVDFNAKKSDKVVGYCAYFSMVNGFEKTIYWGSEKVHNHAKRYSQSYSNKYSAWQTNTEEMALKTVLKNLLSKWGFLSVEMQTAITDDQKSDGEYIDNPPKNEPEIADLSKMTGSEEGHTPVDAPIVEKKEEIEEV